MQRFWVQWSDKWLNVNMGQDLSCIIPSDWKWEMGRATFKMPMTAHRAKTEEDLKTHIRKVEQKDKTSAKWKAKFSGPAGNFSVDGEDVEEIDSFASLKQKQRILQSDMSQLQWRPRGKNLQKYWHIFENKDQNCIVQNMVGSVITRLNLVLKLGFKNIVENKQLKCQLWLEV